MYFRNQIKWFSLVVVSVLALRPRVLSHPRHEYRRTVVRMVDTQEITMPALSSTMTSGRVVSWLKSVGDKVEAGDPIIVVESDKADMEVESYEEGFLAQVLIGEGEDADVGATIGILAARAEDIASIQAGNDTSSAQSQASSTPTETIESAETSPGLGTPVTMPALSSTMKSGRIVSWLKSVGDKVDAGDPVMVVESDKADMEVESYEDGFLASILVEEGAEAEVGAPVGMLAETEDQIAAVAASGAPSAQVEGTPSVALPVKPDSQKPPSQSSGQRVAASGYARRLATDKGIDLSTISGSGPGGRVVARDVEGGGGKPATWTPTPGATTATPSARKLAKSKGLDLDKIQGTGNFGRVTLTDVEAALGLVKKKVTTTATAPSNSIQLPSGAVPMTGMQKAIAKNMEATLAVPVFRVSKTIVTDAFDGLYQKLKPEGVTVSALLAKAVALALEKTPLINAKYDPTQQAIVYNENINVAMAVALDGGLITPTLKNANTLTILDLSAAWKELVSKAKNKELTPDEYTTGT